MAAEITSIKSADQTQSTGLSPEIDRIIQTGQEVPVASGSVRPVFVAAMLSGLLLWLSFTPLDFGPLAWIALVPLCLLLRPQLLPRFSNRALLLSGFLWAVATLQWMRLGHVTMYGALAALSFYVGLYTPAFVAISRRLVRSGVPLWLTVPLVWTALEYLRAYLLTGFSWYYLGHSQYQWTWLVQISDLTGAYGVSFLVAMMSGALAECVPARLLVNLKLADSEASVRTATLRSQRGALMLAVALVVMSCGYGAFRVQPLTATDGPVVAVAQGNFTPELKHDPDQWRRMVTDHDLLTRRAAGLRPDLIVWPETMFPVPDQVIGEGVTDDDLISILPLQGRATNSALAQEEIARWHSGYARELLVNRSQEAGTALLIGLLTEVAQKDHRDRFNSAAFLRPDVGYVGRYDKNHRVIFGEYIPLVSVLPWLAKMTPFSAGFGIDAGTQPAIFEYGKYRFAPIICFEDTVPQLVRRTVNWKDESGNRPDVLINMTNDGWFRGSSELDQHLITATFRCIETRRPMIRAVNAGISAFIDSSGRIRQPEHFWIMNDETSGVVADFEEAETLIDPATGKRWRQCSAVMSGQIPVDGRDTIYLKFGDWFAGLCSVLVLAGMMKSRESRPESAG
ncbi:MAG: apolipoprotein N-acyltransferase [Planctomycetaceae bacterium]